MRREKILREAEISPSAVRYQVITGVVALTASIVGIPLIPIVVPLIYWYYSRYYSRLRVVLTTRELKVHRGIMVTEEKAIPLEKITDLAVFQGPIMRSMDLKGMKVETAGQTSATGALVQLIGITDVDGFRDLVLEQRDRIADRDDETTPASAKAAAGDAAPAALHSSATETALLDMVSDIRDLLRRIDANLDNRQTTGPNPSAKLPTPPEA